MIAQADEMFDIVCQSRHDMGREKYGKLTFVEKPTVEMAMEEVVDLANYARYTFIKLFLLQHQITEIQEDAIKNASGFVSTWSLLGVKKV